MSKQLHSHPPQIIFAMKNNNEKNSTTTRWKDEKIIFNKSSSFSPLYPHFFHFHINVHLYIYLYSWMYIYPFYLIFFYSADVEKILLLLLVGVGVCSHSSQQSNHCKKEKKNKKRKKKWIKLFNLFLFRKKKSPISLIPSFNFFLFVVHQQIQKHKKCIFLIHTPDKIWEKTK